MKKIIMFAAVLMPIFACADVYASGARTAIISPNYQIDENPFVEEEILLGDEDLQEEDALEIEEEIDGNIAESSDTEDEFQIYKSDVYEAVSSSELYLEEVETEERWFDLLGEEVHTDEMLTGYLQQELVGGISLFSTSFAGDHLTSYNKQVYDLVKAEVEKIAVGTRTSTRFNVPTSMFADRNVLLSAEDLGLDVIYQYDASTGKYSLSTEAKEAWLEKTGIQVDATAILRAVSFDCPYEMYWRGLKYSHAWVFAYTRDDSGKPAKMILSTVTEHDDTPATGYRISFSVASEYAMAGVSYETDPAKITPVQFSIERVRSIIETAATLESDWDRLQYFYTTICALTEYNQAAVYKDDAEYGNPWQLIYVFDDDPSTKVVCEGYSKAFQYLCELTCFDSDEIYAFSVSGRISPAGGTGDHMWNVIHMDDGKNYIVDLTNCDGSVTDDGLFITYSHGGSFEDGYLLDYKGRMITFSYKEKTTSIFDREDLEISDTPYALSPVQIKAEEIAALCLAECSTQYEKALWLNDWICENGVHDSAEQNISAENVLLYGKGSSESYYRGYAKLLETVGVQTEKISGSSAVWNAVNLDGIWCQVDVFQNDNTISDENLNPRHIYFGLDQTSMNLVHRASTMPAHDFTSLACCALIKEGFINGLADPYVDAVQLTLEAGGTEGETTVGYAHNVSLIYNLVVQVLNRHTFTVDGVIQNVKFSYVTQDTTHGKLVYSVPAYKVVFISSETATGTMDSVWYQYGVSNTLPKCSYSRKGYQFAGWGETAASKTPKYTDKATIQITEGKDGKIVNLYAIWKPIIYMVTLMADGGSGIQTEFTYSIESTTIYLPTPTKTGFTFLGWYKDAAMTKKVTAISSGSTGNKTFYGKWQENQYHISFKGNGATSGSMTQITAIPYSQKITLPANAFSRRGYRFIGWNKKADGSSTEIANKAVVSKLTKTDDKTVALYAMWEIKQYKLTYVLDGGTNATANPATYTVDSATITLQEPTKKGYLFKGWYLDAEKTKAVSVIKNGQVGNKTLYAKWSAIRYDIRLNGNGATSGTMTGLKSCKYGSSYVLPLNAYKRTGYKFLGWNTKADGSGTLYTDGAKVKNLSATNGKCRTLYATWKLQKYQITYYMNGGINAVGNPTTYKVTMGDVTLQDPTRKGYLFKGWYQDATMLRPIRILSKYKPSRYSLYAKWSAIKYNICFEGNGATAGGMSDLLSCKYGSTIMLPANTFRRKGYVFAEWNTKSDGSGKAYANEANVKNLTSVNGKNIKLYAIWRKK